MKKSTLLVTITLAIVFFASLMAGAQCTSVVVGKDASVDGR